MRTQESRVPWEESTSQEKASQKSTQEGQTAWQKEEDLTPGPGWDPTRSLGRITTSAPEQPPIELHQAEQQPRERPLQSSASKAEQHYRIYNNSLLWLPQGGPQGFLLSREEEPDACMYPRFRKQVCPDPTRRRPWSTHPYTMTGQYLVKNSKLQYLLSPKSFCSSEP
jgi:hypothetical protein